MAHHYAEFTTTPSGLVAALKTQITTSTDWSNITGDIVKATTTRGAELVLNLNKVAVTSAMLGLSAWRTHNGSTGTDESRTVYLAWRASGGATSDTLYCIVSASKEHLFISVEGPKGGDTNAISSTEGSNTSTLYLGDLVPYHGGDTEETCVLVAMYGSGLNNASYHHCFVGRDQGATRPWVPAILATLAAPTAGYAISTTLTSYSKGDGKLYLWPYVVVEIADGIRGRLADAFFAGWTTGSALLNEQDVGLSVGQDVTYDSKTYRVLRSHRHTSASSAHAVGTPWARSTVTTSYVDTFPLVAVRKA